MPPAAAPQGRPRSPLLVAAAVGLGLRLLQHLARAVREQREATEDPQVAADTFVDAFERAHGRRCPAFLRCSFREALQRANRESKFLLLYLHSSLHESTSRFCEQTLCDKVVVDFLHANVLVWGGDVRHSEAHQVSGMLQNTTFPHLSLVMSGPSSRPLLLASHSGRGSAESLLLLLAQALEDHGAALVAVRADNEEREYNRTLRAQQDAEYAASLARDQAKAGADEARRREAEEQAAAAARNEAAEAERERASKAEAEALVARRAALASSLISEPPAGPGAVQIMVRFPDGKRLQRRFLGEGATMCDVYDWVEAAWEETCAFRLVGAYPRCVYERVLQTVVSSGLDNSTSLLVERVE